MRELAIHTLEQFILTMQQQAILKGERPYNEPELLSLLCQAVEPYIRPPTNKKLPPPIKTVTTGRGVPGVELIK